MKRSRLNRYTPMRRFNGKRRARLRVMQYTAGMGYDDWIRAKPCACC